MEIEKNLCKCHGSNVVVFNADLYFSKLQGIICA